MIRTDDKNPDPALRDRRLLGTEVLHGLRYNFNHNEWLMKLFMMQLPGKIGIL